MLDHFPTWARDLTIALSATLLAWIGSDIVPLMKDHGGLAAILAPLVLGIVTATLPITRAYGVGSRGQDYPSPSSDG